MAKSAVQLARRVVEKGTALEVLTIHEFQNDSDAHDDEVIGKLYEQFKLDFSRALAELSTEYGEPWKTGQEDDELIPLNGVFQFSIWEINGGLVFLAAAHEDRRVPILLMVGASSA